MLARIVGLAGHAQGRQAPRIQRLADRAAGVLAWLLIGIAAASTYWCLVEGLPLGKTLAPRLRAAHRLPLHPRPGLTP